MKGDWFGEGEGPRWEGNEKAEEGKIRTLMGVSKPGNAATEV